MTLRDALRLKRGDFVRLTRDERTWRVSKVKPDEQYVMIRRGRTDVLELRGAAAMRSLKLVEMAR